MTNERRDRILKAAEQLFSHYGAAKTTVADIARACDIAVGSVYLDFASKQAILRALSEQKVSFVAERLDTVEASQPDSAAKLHAMLVARIEALFDLAEGGTHRCELVRCIDSKEAESKEAERKELGFGAAVRARFERVLQDAEAKGELPPGNGKSSVASLARTVELAFAALSPPALFRMQRNEAVRAARALADLVVAGLFGQSRGSANVAAAERNASTGGRPVQGGFGPGKRGSR